MQAHNALPFRETCQSFLSASISERIYSMQRRWSLSSTWRRKTCTPRLIVLLSIWAMRWVKRKGVSPHLRPVESRMPKASKKLFEKG